VDWTITDAEALVVAKVTLAAVPVALKLILLPEDVMLAPPVPACNVKLLAPLVEPIATTLLPPVAALVAMLTV